MPEWISEKCDNSSLRNAWDATVTLRTGNDAFNYLKTESQYTQEKKTQSQQHANFNIPAKRQALPEQQPKEENQSPNIAAAQKPTLSEHIRRLRNIKQQHTKPPFLYEHYPLKPALLYGTPTSYVRDPLKRLDQITYLAQNSLHSISAILPTSQCVLVNTQLNSSDKLQSEQHKRLQSGADECTSDEETIIADTARKTRNAYEEAKKSVESVCSTCRRDAFLVPHGAEYCLKSQIAKSLDEPQERDMSTASTSCNNLSPKVSSNLDKQTNLLLQDSILLYRKPSPYQTQNALEAVESNVKASSDAVKVCTPTKSQSSGQASVSTNSLAPDYIVSVPIFEVLTTNETYNHANPLSLKHKDSLLFYANLKRKRHRSSCTGKTLEVRKGKLAGYVRFTDESNLVCRPSDEDVVFRSAKRLNFKSKGWEESRIAWLAELERRQEVRRRRQRRLEQRTSQHTASGSVWEQCSFLCQRIRLWLAKWNI